MKKFIALLLALSMMCILVACGSDEAAKENTNEQEQVLLPPKKAKTVLKLNILISVLKKEV
ncbi:MAG: hypothetical protein NC122_08180 [Faecalibacterium sp.]|nr:hypothetical protein [Ruminococcus sp.]MCM1392456.1 hypothetical protein [Ruminococcus sp.]MCM1486171.1 hypothetical protein [Faecalibacterium sp.]